MNGLSCEMIIHPGETLKDVLEERGMSQQELAFRAGVSAKHVSTVLNGEKSISVHFAKQLEYSLGIDAEFWINLQTDYDKEMLEFEELHSISEFEKNVVNSSLKDLIVYLEEKYILPAKTSIEQLILDLRKFLNVSNLENIKSVVSQGAFRAQTSKKVNPYALFTWQQLCEVLALNIQTSNLTKEEQKSSLLSEIPNLKKIMFMNQTKLIEELTNLFSICGISFITVPYFKGVPVQGFIRTTNEDKTIISMTFRQKKADIFWFTLFHEIGHFINGDTKERFIDFDSVENTKEIKADTFAKNSLINPKDFDCFLQESDFSLEKINRFSEKQNVPNFIVIGRLQKENLIPWSKYQEQMVKYN